MRIIGSMTTLPGRFDTIRKPIESILSQTIPLDILYLHIPQKTLKGDLYNIPNDFENSFQHIKTTTKLVLNRCNNDYGPITKLYPVLELEKDNDTCIITFDDDIIVQPHLVSMYIEKVKMYPNACLALSGVCIGNFPFHFQFAIDNPTDTQVDWIQGVHTVLYRRGFFNHDLLQFGDNYLKQELQFNDDHRISAYLASKNISRISLGYHIQSYLRIYTDNQDDALSMRRFNLVKEHSKIIQHFSKLGLYYRTYSITRSIIFIPISIILITILTFFLLPTHDITIKLILSITVGLFLCCYYKLKLALFKY